MIRLGPEVAGQRSVGACVVVTSHVPARACPERSDEHKPGKVQTSRCDVRLLPVNDRAVVTVVEKVALRA